MVDGGHDGIVRLPLERDGVEAEVKNAWEDQPPLMCAAHGGYEAIVKLLWKREDVDLAARTSSAKRHCGWPRKADTEVLWIY